MTRYLDFKTIGEITEKIIDYRGKTPLKTDRGIKLITAKVIKDGHIVDGKHEYISEEAYPAWMTRGFPQKWDVLITTEAPLGEVALLRTNEKIALAQRVILLRGKSNIIDQIYYMYALKTAFVQEQLRSRSVSTTVAGIKQSDLVEVKIPLLPIEEQKRIATIAQKCDRLRRTRRYTRQLSDSYLRSVFLKMFGDPIANSMNWDVDTLGSNTTFITSGSRGWAAFYAEKGDYFLRVQNVGKNELLLNDLAYVQAPDTAESRRTQVKSGDILVSITADLGRTAVIPSNFPTAYINQHLCLIRVKGINPVFLASYLSSEGGQHQFDALDRSGVKSGLNFDDIRGLKVIFPPLSLQEKFAQIVQRFERLRIQQREADRQAEHLFQTILHRAFRGEL